MLLEWCLTFNWRRCVLACIQGFMFEHVITRQNKNAQSSIKRSRGQVVSQFIAESRKPLLVMNSHRIMMHGASVLALVCMVSAAKLPGYSTGGDSGLGVDLRGVGGHAGGAGGAGSVFQAVFVGRGNLPASAIGGAAGGFSGGAAGGFGGGAVGQEYSGPSTGPVAPVVTVEEEYTGPVAAVSPVVTVEEEYTGPSTGPVVPIVAVEEEYTGPSIEAGPVAAVSPIVTVDEVYNVPVAPVVTVDEEYSAPVAPVPNVEEEYTEPSEVAHVSPPVSEYISPNH
ncbi:uncharacterized protein [Penaeus vannamei]|uniref:uncharacterized protein n=1 Tax=Penaeus vannamei TaxID=6689 RepID=UPI00387F69A0